MLKIEGRSLVLQLAVQEAAEKKQEVLALAATKMKTRMALVVSAVLAMTQSYLRKESPAMLWEQQLALALHQYLVNQELLAFWLPFFSVWPLNGLELHNRHLSRISH